MIQRTQSVYLFFVAILMMATSFFQIMGYRTEGALYTLGLSSLGAYSFLPDFVSPALSLVAGIIALATIFLYKKRKLQIKLCYGIFIAIILLYISILCSYYGLMSEMGNSINCFPKVALAFPLIAFILVWMAIVGIKKDEKLVSSLDRLR